MSHPCIIRCVWAVLLLRLAGVAGGRRRDAEQGLRPGLHLAAGRPGPGQGRAGYYIQASESGGEPPGRWWAQAPRRSGSSPARWSSASRMTCRSASAGLPAAPHWAGRRAAAGKPLTCTPDCWPPSRTPPPDANWRQAVRFLLTRTRYLQSGRGDVLGVERHVRSPRITVSSREFLSGVD